ncbi:DUF6011 domain-containing protein [Methanosarcina sp. MTP4]|uniref:DUF6011 domain-containing protein n=1 Tax=Methanosarcina sp. MTP4 TaxID=1434100 RepID=UPI00064EF4F8|nr:DUF6011 domain-containing protein [Methanosarcina sp. MTP4]
MVSKVCLRCNRPLKNPLSQERGYGPECWKKIQQHVEKRQDYPLPCSISDPIIASETLAEISRRARVANRKKCDCGKSLVSGEVKTYDHDCGETLAGFSHPQWVYLTCPKCGYQWAYWKLRGPSLKDLSEPQSTPNPCEVDMSPRRLF